jgi:hypothetical protein
MATLAVGTHENWCSSVLGYQSSGNLTCLFERTLGIIDYDLFAKNIDEMTGTTSNFYPVWGFRGKGYSVANKVTPKPELVDITMA